MATVKKRGKSWEVRWREKKTWTDEHGQAEETPAPRSDEMGEVAKQGTKGAKAEVTATTQRASEASPTCTATQMTTEPRGSGSGVLQPHLLAHVRVRVVP